MISDTLSFLRKTSSLRETLEHRIMHLGAGVYPNRGQSQVCWIDSNSLGYNFAVSGPFGVGF